MIYDDRDLVRPISAYMERLADYWKRSPSDDAAVTPRMGLTAARAR